MSVLPKQEVRSVGELYDLIGRMLKIGLLDRDAKLDVPDLYGASARDGVTEATVVQGGTPNEPEPRLLMLWGKL